MQNGAFLYALPAGLTMVFQQHPPPMVGAMEKP